MRCFIGAFLPCNIQASIRDLRPELPGVRWTRPERFHITLKFFADLSSEEVPSTIDEVRVYSRGFPLMCSATVLDGFPSRNRARVVIVRIDTQGCLESLIGDSSFQPHVTVGYARQRPVKVPAIPIGMDFSLDTVCLVESKQGQYRVVSAH